MRKSAKAELLATTAAPPPPPHGPPHAGAPSLPAAGPPIAATSTPQRRERRASHRRDSNGERDDGDGDGSDPPDGPPKRDHHGDRTVPPPATFSLSELSDDTLLTQREVAAIGRWAVSTVETWRRRGHPLKWITIAGGFIRYRAADLRHFLASGQPRRRGRTAATPAPKRTSAKPPAQYTKTVETHSQDSAPPRRRASPRPRTADGLAAGPAEPSS